MKHELHTVISKLKNALYLLLVNGALMILIIYGVEYYLRKSDPFLNLPFDRGYYSAYQHRYEGRVERPIDADDYYYTWEIR